MSFLNRMSAAERTKLADSISSANEHLTIDERRDLVDALTVALGTDLNGEGCRRQETRNLEPHLCR
jgi:hypothetical protein